MTTKTFKRNHPIGRSFHSGLYGFERRYDCLNLSRCFYRTKRQAEIARHEAALWEVARAATGVR